MKRTTDRRESCSLERAVCQGQICGPRFCPGLGCTTLWGRRRHKVFQFRQPQNIEIALIGLHSETNATVYFVLTAVQISLLHLTQPSGYDVLRPRTGREHKPWSRLRAAT